MGTKKPLKDSKSLEQVLKPLIEGILSEGIGEARLKLNGEANSILKTEQFKNEIQKTRKILNVPQLAYKNDWHSFDVHIDNKTRTIEDSRYLQKLSSAKGTEIKLWDSEVTRILKKYKFSEIYRDKVEHYLLYNQVPAETTLFQVAMVLDALNGFTHSYTTQEKWFAKWIFRERSGLPLRGKIPKELLPIYKKLEANLNKEKNQQRRKKIPINQTVEVNRKIKYGENYKDIADKFLDPNDDTIIDKGEIKRKAKALKQNNYRFKKRLS